MNHAIVPCLCPQTGNIVRLMSPIRTAPRHEFIAPKAGQSSGEGTGGEGTIGDSLSSADAVAARRPDVAPESIGRLQPLAMKVCRPVFHRLWEFDVEGLEHLPVEGPAIFCPNHVSVIDSFMLPAVLPKPITYVGKAEYLDDWKTAKLFPALGMIPIDRSGGGKAIAALDAAREVLDSGGWFGIYPEGTRSRDGKLHKGHTGAARLAVESGAPILPVGLIGTREIQPPDQKRPRLFKRVKIRIGAPITIDPSRIGDRALYRQVIDEVMFEIQGLCGQEYVNTYARSGGAALAAEAPPSKKNTVPVSRRLRAAVSVPRPLLDSV